MTKIKDKSHIVREEKIIKQIDLNTFLQKARDTRKIILPESGLELEIKKVYQKEWVSKMDTAFIISNQNKSQDEIVKEIQSDSEKRKSIENMIITICKLGCKYPSLTNIDTVRENELYINYLSDNDLNFMFNEIMEFSGINSKVPSNTKK